MLQKQSLCILLFCTYSLYAQEILLSPRIDQDTFFLDTSMLPCEADTATYMETIERRNDLRLGVKIHSIADKYVVGEGLDAYTPFQRWKALSKRPPHCTQQYERLLRYNKIKFQSYYHDGEWRFFYANGQLKEKTTYKKGIKIDTTTYWYDDGQLKSQWLYSKEGMTLLHFWSPEGDILVENGEGEWTESYESGQILARGKVEDGKQIGLWQAWHENGQLMHQFKVENNRFEGREMTWASNGQQTYDRLMTPKNTLYELTYWNAQGDTLFSGDAPNKDGNAWSWKTDWGYILPKTLNMDGVKAEIAKAYFYGGGGDKVIVRHLVDREGKSKKSVVIQHTTLYLASTISEEASKLQYTPLIYKGNIACRWLTVPFRFL